VTLTPHDPTAEDEIPGQDPALPRLRAPVPARLPDDEGGVERLLRLLRNRKWIVLSSVIIVPLAALLFSLSSAKQYTSQADVLFESSRQSSGSIDISRQAATNAKIVALPVIAARAATIAHVTPAKMRAATSTSPDPNSDLIKIVAVASSPARAAAYANAYANAVVGFVRDTRTTDLKNRESVLSTYLNSLPPAERQGSRGQALSARLDQLRVQEALQSDANSQNVQFLQPARLPSSPSSPKTKRNAILGLLLGIALGIGLASLMERLNRGINTVEELERIFGLPILTRIPRLRAIRTASARQLEVPPPGEAVEAFRSLRANLRYYNVDGQLRSVLVTSPMTADGKSTVADGLATTMAAMGDSVILVKADLRKSSSWGQRTGGNGLSSVLAGGSLDEAIIQVPLSADGLISGERRVAVLPSGDVPPNPTELLESERMRRVLSELEERYDVVILDSPALAAVSDALPLVPQASGVLIVSRLRHTDRDLAGDLRQQLSMLGGQMLGIVANFSDPQRSSYYTAT
jgi:capsular exopolysaccharide synthesis family protein